MFYSRQSDEQKQEYIKLLKVVGSISNLFSESNVPYLYYRAAENIFCKAFEANNLSRGDITFDASKDKVGIALKTFKHGNGKRYEKIAEFNQEIDSFRNETNEKAMRIISKLRNERIQTAIDLTEVHEMVYHLVTRKEGKFELHEEKLKYIDLNKIKLDDKKTTSKVIHFSDGSEKYKFSIAKSTLFKLFNTKNPVEILDVEILSNPFEFLLSEESKSYYMVHESTEDNYESVVLPLYSARSKKVELASGLNQWNADDGKRKRKPNEIYIPIPSWIHKVFEGFFPYDVFTGSKQPFRLLLPNNKEIKASICQGGGKGFMSNPNKELGYWLLRNVLKVEEGKLVTMETLHEKGIDSVVVTKLEDLLYKIDFAKTGTYEEFEENNKK